MKSSPAYDQAACLDGAAGVIMIEAGAPVASPPKEEYRPVSPSHFQRLEAVEEGKIIRMSSGFLCPSRGRKMRYLV